MKIESLDHLVLTVASIETTCTFYERVLGMTRDVFGAGRVALVFGNQKINLHQVGQEFEPKARLATAGSADLCFIVDDVAAAHEHILACDVKIIEGPIKRTGANGAILSVYIRDPDGNLLEISQYL